MKKNIQSLITLKGFKILNYNETLLSLVALENFPSFELEQSI